MEIETLYEEEDGFVKLYFDEKIGWIISVEIPSWNLSSYKRYIPIWINVLTTLKQRGISTVYGLCVSDANVKFNEMFGFSYIGWFAQCDDGTLRKVTRMDF
jgi:hypothetical protein